VIGRHIRATSDTELHRTRSYHLSGRAISKINGIASDGRIRDCSRPEDNRKRSGAGIRRCGEIAVPSAATPIPEPRAGRGADDADLREACIGLHCRNGSSRHRAEVACRRDAEVLLELRHIVAAGTLCERAGEGRTNGGRRRNVRRRLDGRYLELFELLLQLGDLCEERLYLLLDFVGAKGARRKRQEYGKNGGR